MSARLLAARLEAAPHVVQHLDHHFVGAVLEEVGDVESEIDALADVRSGKLAVDVDPGLVIDAAEMNSYPLAFHGRRQLERAAIPDVLQFLGVAQPEARQLALGAEGDDDLAR